MRKSDKAAEQTGTAEEANTTGEVMAVPSAFSREDLGNIASWDDAVRLAIDVYGGVLVADTEIGDGFKKATEDDQRRLIGVPLFFLEWTFRAGDFTDYVSI